MKFVVLAVGLVVAASIATYARYESFDPCDWLERDMVRQSGLPPLVVHARIRAAFLVRGIAEPGPYDCLKGWWSFKAKELPKES
ncbi:MAG: hypothetical protein ACE5KF_04770 [Kiloniellaceae bacterium]